MNKWRVGRKVRRTIYIQRGLEAEDGDVLVGLMDTPELAAMVVDAVNTIHWDGWPGEYRAPKRKGVKR